MGARHIVAMQIAHDPLVRQCIRTAYFERAKIKTRPTQKGMKVSFCFLFLLKIFSLPTSLS